MQFYCAFVYSFEWYCQLMQNLPAVPPVNAALEPHHQMLPVGIITSVSLQ